MAASDQNLNNVRSILGKMDRSISDARKRRLGDPMPSRQAEPSDGDDLLIGRAEAGSPSGQPAADAPEPSVSPMRARYGKAKPIGPSDGSEDAGQPMPQDSRDEGDRPFGFRARPA